jgi:integrase
MLQVKSGKGRRARTIPVAPRIGSVLRRFCGKVDHNGEKMSPGRVPGHGPNARQAQARFARWKTAAGVRPELTIRSFRAGFATTLHRGCGDVVLVSRVLGHRDLRPTLRYVEPHTRRLSRAIARSFAAIVRTTLNLRSNTGAFRRTVLEYC